MYIYRLFIICITYVNYGQNIKRTKKCRAAGRALKSSKLQNEKEDMNVHLDACYTGYVIKQINEKFMLLV